MAKLPSSSSSSSMNIIPEDYELMLDGSEAGWVEARTHCDHLGSLSSDLVHIPTPDSICNRCQHPDENWLCLCCKDVLCSRFVNKHMLEHYQQKDHNLALSYSDLSVWCFSCDAYLDAQAIAPLRPAYETAYVLKSGPTDDWTIVLPRRGKKNRNVSKFVIPKREKEVQLWTPVDLETSPDRELKLFQKMENCIQKLAVSEFHHTFLDQVQNPDMLYKFLKVLGSEKNMEMVIYGIGSIESFETSRLQLSLAILMKRSFDWIGEIQVFDPIISVTESKVLTSLGCCVLSVNEQGRRQALKPTLFFMPHCEAELYDNLLEANWEVDKLNLLIVFGNSFGEYEQHASVCKSSAVAQSRKHVLAARNFTQEFRISALSDDYFRAFHNTSWHFISPPIDAHLPCINYD